MSLDDRSFRFSHALVRRPARSATQGLRAIDSGPPDVALLGAQHADYVAALRRAGVEVTVLEPLEAYPDAHFVEDAALCLPEGAVRLRPGAPSRPGEAEEIAAPLEALYTRVDRIARGFVEGGDVLCTGREILVGRSARTDAEGIAALERIVAAWGHSLREVVTPPGVLHFKTDCALLDAETILATRRLAASGCLDGYRIVPVPEGEEPAANVVRVNDRVLMPDGYPRTAETVAGAGYRVELLANSECAKLDGGMSCLSLRFTPS